MPALQHPINPTAETRFLCGKSVYLRPFEKKDLLYLYQWGNDPDIRSLTAEVTPMTSSGLEKFWEKVSNEMPPMLMSIHRGPIAS